MRSTPGNTRKDVPGTRASVPGRISGVFLFLLVGLLIPAVSGLDGADWLSRGQRLRSLRIGARIRLGVRHQAAAFSNRS